LLLGLQEIEEDLRFSCNQFVLGLCEKFQFLYAVLEPQFWTHFVVVLLNLNSENLGLEYILLALSLRVEILGTGQTLISLHCRVMWSPLKKHFQHALKDALGLHHFNNHHAFPIEFVEFLSSLWMSFEGQSHYVTSWLLRRLHHWQWHVVKSSDIM
jgi:hypothetical protein